VVFNGSFYYQQRNSDLVVKLDLTSLKKISECFAMVEMHITIN